MNSKLMMMNNNQKQQLARRIVHKSRVRVPPSKPQPPSVSSPNCVGGADCFYVKSLIENRSNFKRSAVPARVMYYEDGLWVDLEWNVVDSIRSGFSEADPMVEVEIGGVRYLFDFYRMLQIDFESGSQRSVAWIDVEGKCFFPKSFVGFESGKSMVRGVGIGDSGDMTPNIQKIEIEVRVGGVCDARKRKKEDLEEEVGEEKSEGSCSNAKKQLAMVPDSESPKQLQLLCDRESPDDQGRELKKQRQLVSDLESPRWPKTKLMKDGDMACSAVKKLFMNWIGGAQLGATITAIHQCVRTAPLDIARYQVFQKQLESTKAARGDPQMVFAWFRSSADGVASILSHGFGNPSKVSGSEDYGVGIYLSPLKSTPMSGMLSDGDDHGENHVILCRVILGKCEKVQAGSQQIYPSGVGYDTGVDDINNPNLYIVWRANMNTHILPECVVSYKPTHNMTGQLTGSSFFKWVPNATLTAKFFSKLKEALPSSKLPELQRLCSTFKEGKVDKDNFMKQLRSIVGDDMLRWAIREIRG